ncbi:MAG: hypothetical protein AAGD96_12315 [Chloroflexota bacterium]
MSYVVFSMNPYARKVGEIRPTGDVFDSDGQLAGKVSSDGTIRNANGIMLGIINRDGRIVGKGFGPDEYDIDLKGYILRDGIIIGAVKKIEKGIPEVLAYWTACAVLLHEDVISDDPHSAKTVISPADKLLDLIHRAKVSNTKNAHLFQTIKKRAASKKKTKPIVDQSN